MSVVRYTLLSDGSSDRALIPLLTCLLCENGVAGAIDSAWADLGRVLRPTRKLPERIQQAIQWFPCDLLFVHRDAEAEPWDVRKAEIERARSQALETGIVPPTVCVVPVRMLETWLLFDELALRRASGNPQGREPLPLPRLADLEDVIDPKSVLHECIRVASGLQGRRRKKLSVSDRIHRVANLVNDFSPLRTLRAFRALESEIADTVTANGWNTSKDE
ncbi:MAG: hypothetical protein HY331_17175 [Chloroflexi bacterium]|nr:hypothetical protein [Chloroflexota bacterium]